MKIENGDKYEVETHSSSSNLYVKDVVESDNGSYQCRVENSTGFSLASCELFVEGKNK